MSIPHYDLTALARLDLLDIWNHLAEKTSLDVADRVLADLREGARKISETPGLCHKRPDLTPRKLLFYRVHSYLLIYRRDTKPICLVRCVHAAREVKELLNN